MNYKIHLFQMFYAALIQQSLLGMMGILINLAKPNEPFLSYIQNMLFTSCL